MTFYSGNFLTFLFNNSNDVFFQVMKTCVVLLFASLLIVGFMGEAHAKISNRRLLGPEVNRNVPGGPNACYHCLAGGKIRSPNAPDQVHADSEIKFDHSSFRH